MNNKVLSFLKETKGKATDFVSEKTNDAKRYAEERIKAIQDYLNKNGKKIKTTATALALAGLTTLSATTMSGCDEISQIITPGESISSISSNDPFVPSKGPYAEPITKTPQEIEESGITAEDVLAEFDRLVWDINLIIYTRSIKRDHPDNWEQIVRDSKTSAQFVKMTPELTSEYSPYPMYGILTRGYDDQFDLLTQGKENKWFYDVYPVNIYYNNVTFGHQNEDYNQIRVGVYKDQFEPVGDLMASDKFILTIDKLDQLALQVGGGDSTYYSYENSQGYSAFEITRETIKNASQEELYALYDLARSIRSISIDLQYPDFSPIADKDSEKETN